MYKFIFTDLIMTDFDQIEDFYLENIKDEKVLINLFSSLHRKVIQLTEMPYSRALLRDDKLSAKGYRALQVKNFLLFYEINEDYKVIYLHRFLDGRSDWVNILKDDIVE